MDEGLEKQQHGLARAYWIRSSVKPSIKAKTTLQEEKTMRELVKRLIYEEQGQDLIEYTLILGFMALAAVAVYSVISDNISTIWSTVNSTMAEAASTGGS